MNKKELYVRIPLRRILSSISIFVSAAVIFIGANYVFAVAPNPGHDFTEVSGGIVQGDVLYGSAVDTIGALPKNSTASRYLSNSGASNNPAWAQVDVTNGVTGVLPTANGGTGTAFFAVAGPTVSRTYTFPDAAATVLTSAAAVTVAQGGTGLSTLTANNVMLGNGASAPTFVAPGTSGNVLTSNGTTWTSAASTMTTVITKPASGLGTGGNAAAPLASLTVYIVGLFNIPYSITVNQLAYRVGGVTTAGSYRICVYDEAGTTKSIDVTDVPAAGVNTVAVGAVTLTPGNYYIAMGCATTCNNTVFKFTTVANTMINTSAVPAGKKVYEGTATMTSGTCNATLPTITGVISDTAVIRLDN